MTVPAYLPLPPGVQLGEVATARGLLGMLTAAPSEPSSTVVLVPGFTGSKEDFLPLLPLLAEAGHAAVAVDLRGQGRSAGCDDAAAYAVAALAADVLTVIDGRAAAGQRVHLLGHSFGGLVARQAVLTAPGAVASLTLLCSGPGALPRPRADIVELLVQALPRLDPPAIWAAKQDLERAAGVAALPAHVEAWQRRRFLDNCPTGLLRMAEQLLAEADRVDELARATRDARMPVHVAYGQHDDAWPAAAQADMARRLGARETVLPGLGHSPAAEDPRATAGVLSDFWQQLDAASRGARGTESADQANAPHLPAGARASRVSA